MRVKILWLNLRKRGRNASVLRALERIAGRDRYDFIMLQETFPKSQSNLAISSEQLGEAIYLSCDLSAFNVTRRSDAKVLFASPRLLAVQTGGVAIFNAHFSPYSSAERENDLRNLRERLSALNGMPAVLGGDFNFAPRECDGLYGSAPSTWTTFGERRLFNALLSDMELIDFLAPPVDALEYTIIRKRNGMRIEFRCDLVLCSRRLAARAAGRYLHETREGPWAFSDHSGISFEMSAIDET